MVEIEPALVEWMRDGTIPHGPAMLADERANPVVADIAAAVGEASDASYDLVLLDVDNGPGPPRARAQRRALPAAVPHRGAADAAPGRCRGDLVRGRGRRELEATLEQVFGNAETTGYDVTLQDRDEKYWLHVARVGAVASAE